MSEPHQTRLLPGFEEPTNPTRFLVRVPRLFLRTWGLLTPPARGRRPGVPPRPRLRETAALVIPRDDGTRLEIGGFPVIETGAHSPHPERNPEWQLDHAWAFFTLLTYIGEEIEHPPFSFSFRGYLARLLNHAPFSSAHRDHFRRILLEVVDTHYQLVSADGRRAAGGRIIDRFRTDKYRFVDGSPMGTTIRELRLCPDFLRAFWWNRADTQLLDFTTFASFRDDLARLAYLVLPRSAYYLDASTPHAIGARLLARRTGALEVDCPAHITEPSARRRWHHKALFTLRQLFERPNGVLAQLDGASLPSGIFRTARTLRKNKLYGQHPDPAEWDLLVDCWVEGGAEKREVAEDGKLLTLSRLSPTEFAKATAHLEPLTAQETFLLCERAKIKREDLDRPVTRNHLLRAKALLGRRRFEDVLQELTLQSPAKPSHYLTTLLNREVAEWGKEQALKTSVSPGRA